MLYRLPPRYRFAEACRGLHLGDETDPDDVAAMLIRGGYQNVELVEVKGEFARRGDILDIYPLTADTPIRVEFFGDEVIPSVRSIRSRNVQRNPWNRSRLPPYGKSFLGMYRSIIGKPKRMLSLKNTQRHN